MESVSNLFTEQSIPDVSDGASFTNWLGVVPSTSIPASPPGSSSAHRDAITLTWMISGPIIFFVGICGNALILVVMTRHKMTGTSTCVHLCIMALADMVVLTIGLVPEWFEVSLKRKFKEIHPVTCKLEKFLFYTSGDTSIWVLVIFTLDRLVAIAFPLRKKSVCTPSRAKLFGAVVLACAVVKNFHVFWTRGPEYKMGKNNDTYLKSNCGKPTPGFNQFESFIRPWIVFATVNVIPFAVILCCNVVIIRALCRVRRVATIGALVSPSVATDRSMVQMTAMCLSASFCFLVCITPSIIVIIGRPYWEKTAPYDTAKGVSNMLTYINHSVNFFLYCVTGRRFRRLLAWWACRRCLPGFAGAMGGESTEAHVTFMHRGSSGAFGGFSRKSSVGVAVDGPRRASQDYVRSNSHVTRFGDRTTKENARETDV